MLSRNCEVTGQHHFEPRFDESPQLVITADDIIKFQGQLVVTAERMRQDSGKAVTYYTTADKIPKLDIRDQIALVEAHKKKVYLGDCCKHCGKFVRYERKDHP